MAIYKKEEAWWPKLQKGNKLNFVKVDFQKWVDEDDEEEEAPADPMGGLDFQSLMAQAGAAGGLPGMGDMVSSFNMECNKKKKVWFTKKTFYSLKKPGSTKLTKKKKLKSKIKLWILADTFIKNKPYYTLFLLFRWNYALSFLIFVFFSISGSTYFIFCVLHFLNH